MNTQFNRIAIEGAVNTLREAYGTNQLDSDNELLKDFVGWAAWNFGSRAEAIIRLRQAADTLERMINIAETKEDVSPPSSTKKIRKDTSHVVQLRDALAPPHERD